MRDRAAARAVREPSDVRAGAKARWAAACSGVLAVVLLTAIWTASASAVVVRLADGSRVGYQPASSPLPAAPLLRAITPLSRGAAVEYHGGPVMTSNTNYAFYWAPGGAAAYPAGYISGIDPYLERPRRRTAASDKNVDSVAAQYTNGQAKARPTTPHFAGAIIDTDPYPANGCTAVADLPDRRTAPGRADRGYIDANGCRADLSHEYFMLTPPAVGSCFEASGLECSAGTEQPRILRLPRHIPDGCGVIVYANNPYSTGIAGCDNGQASERKHRRRRRSRAASATSTTSRSRDPELERLVSARRRRDRRQMPHLRRSERIRHAARHGSRRRPLQPGRRRGQYWYQQEWSNRGLTCLQRLGLRAARGHQAQPRRRGARPGARR